MPSKRQAVQRLKIFLTASCLCPLLFFFLLIAFRQEFFITNPHIIRSHIAACVYGLLFLCIGFPCLYFCAMKKPGLKFIASSLWIFGLMFVFSTVKKILFILFSLSFCLFNSVREIATDIMLQRFHFYSLQGFLPFALTQSVIYVLTLALWSGLFFEMMRLLKVNRLIQYKKLLRQESLKDLNQTIAKKALEKPFLRRYKGLRAILTLKTQKIHRKSLG